MLLPIALAAVIQQTYGINAQRLDNCGPAELTVLED